MSVLTGQTNDNLNFSIKRIREDDLELPDDQEMIVSKYITIDEPATLFIGNLSMLSVLGGS
jgi:hypothetical protein